MNRDGKLQDLGRRGVRAQARRVRQHRGDPEPGRPRRRARQAQRGLRPAALHLLGHPRSPQDYSPDVTGRITQRPGPQRSATRSKPFFIWWAPAAPHREDVATTLMGRPGPRPAPGAALRGAEQAATRCRGRRASTSRTSPTSRRTSRPRAVDEPSADRPAAARLPGTGRLAAGGRRPRRAAGQDAARDRTSSRTR